MPMLSKMIGQISIRDLVPEKLQTGDYSRIRATVEQNLTRPEKIDRYATHEAGHLILQKRTGLIQVPSDAIYEGPTIYHDEGHIGYLMAGVRSKRISLFDTTLVYTEPLLEKLATVGVAGNVFELNKFDADEETEPAFRGDFRTFDLHCRTARRRNYITYAGLTQWSSALEQVRHDMQNGLFSDLELDDAKRAVRKHCFGLT